MRFSRTFFAALVYLAVITGAGAHPFASIVSFGDSLSDTSNNPALGDYWHGRWSNGPLWNEYLATNSNATLYDYAYAGSETSDLSNQVASATTSGWNATNTLFTVWSGANDFIDNAATNGTSLTAWGVTINNAVGNIANAVSRLASGGAQYVLVLNLPDLSQLPALNTNAEFRAAKSDIRYLVNQFNNELGSALAGQLIDHPNLRVEIVDDYTLLDAIIANPSMYGFTVVTNDALDALDDPAFDGPGADYLFWDVIHPTTKADGLLAQLSAPALDQFRPFLIAAPASQTVAIGSPVTFSVSALDGATFQWYFGARKIAGATNASYVIPAATAARNGVYHVQVNNGNASVVSGNARLTVEAPPRITVQPRSENGIAGRTAVLSAHATGAAPLSYQWLFNGANLEGATKQTLVLTNLQTNEAGSYTFTAANAVGTATSHPAVLNVIVPPQIISQPQSADVTTGSSLTFNVQAAGTAPLHYQWERNGAPLARQTNSSLTISAVKSAQAGNYRVVVRNQGGAVVSSTAILKVGP